MSLLPLGDVQLAYRVSGEGPPLLLPECNFAWDERLVSRLAECFTVIVASPRDFGDSSRTAGPTYDVAAWASDLQAVASHLGYDRFLVFGYSFTGVLGPWLARRLRASNAVVAVASGGFPLLGDYGVTLAEVEEQAQAVVEDPELLGQVLVRFHPFAARDFYRDIGALPDATLVEDIPCPLFCFWGDQDTDAVAMVLSHEDYRAGLMQRKVPFKVLPGYDHEGLLMALHIAIPEVVQWLLSQAAQQGL